jgi:HPt (histidine-containing phosphotransfer) domain-containing protein
MSQQLGALSEPAASGRIDLPALLDQFGGLREVLREVIEAYLEQFPPLLEEVDGAVANREAAMLGRSAHKLKGAICIFGVAAATEAAAALERAGKAADLADVDRLRARLGTEAECLRAELESLLPSLR